MSYVLGVDAARSITPVAGSITSPAGVAENVPPVAPVVVNVVVPVVQNVPPLTVAAGAALIVTVTWVLGPSHPLAVLCAAAKAVYVPTAVPLGAVVTVPPVNAS